ncbi:hypothetical protein L915_12900, partial [Phytophthora nicotianae]
KSKSMLRPRTICLGRWLFQAVSGYRKAAISILSCVLRTNGTASDEWEGGESTEAHV